MRYTDDTFTASLFSCFTMSYAVSTEMTIYCDLTVKRKASIGKESNYGCEDETLLFHGLFIGAIVQFCRVQHSTLDLVMTGKVSGSARGGASQHCW